jgi:hypothetical protein
MTPLAPTGERMSFYEPARQYDQKALQILHRERKEAVQYRSL